MRVKYEKQKCSSGKACGIRILVNGWQYYEVSCNIHHQRWVRSNRKEVIRFLNGENQYKYSDPVVAFLLENEKFALPVSEFPSQVWEKKWKENKDKPEFAWSSQTILDNSMLKPDFLIWNKKVAQWDKIAQDRTDVYVTLAQWRQDGRFESGIGFPKDAHRTNRWIHLWMWVAWNAEYPIVLVSDYEKKIFLCVPCSRRWGKPVPFEKEEKINVTEDKGIIIEYQTEIFKCAGCGREIL